MTVLDIPAAEALGRRLRGRRHHARPPGVRRPATHLERRDRPPPGASSPAARGPATSPRRCGGRVTAACPWPCGAAATASPDTRSWTTASCSTSPACGAPSSIRRPGRWRRRAAPSTRTSTGRRQAFGLAMTSGYISHTGIAGLTLGGGIGHLMRKMGLAIDALQVVPGGGRRRLDRAGLGDREPRPVLGAARGRRQLRRRHRLHLRAAAARADDPGRPGRVAGRRGPDGARLPARLHRRRTRRGGPDGQPAARSGPAALPRAPARQADHRAGGDVRRLGRGGRAGAGPGPRPRPPGARHDRAEALRRAPEVPRPGGAARAALLLEVAPPRARSPAT